MKSEGDGDGDGGGDGTMFAENVCAESSADIWNPYDRDRRRKFATSRCTSSIGLRLLGSIPLSYREGRSLSLGPVGGTCAAGG